MNQWTHNKHDSPHLFSMAVIYKVAFQYVFILFLDLYDK